MFNFRFKRRRTPQSRNLEAFVMFGTKKFQVKAGFPQGVSQNVISRAIWNNYGTQHIPERPFMNNAYRDNVGDYRRMTRFQALKLLISRRSADDLANDLGERMVDDIRSEIINLDSPANAPSTIAKKGFDDPLIETQEMLDSVTYEVEH